jgi:hypothetical protein
MEFKKKNHKNASDDRKRKVKMIQLEREKPW